MMSIQAEIVSINVGRPQQAIHQNMEIKTGIFKQPVTEPVRLSFHNLAGDEQADLINHGGSDKAVCVYAYEHYPYWERELEKPLDFAAFGENMTTTGLLEPDVCIGDTFRIGEALVQVSQPRQPCFKIGVKHGRPDLTLKVQQTGYTGFYFRVLQEGVVSVDDIPVLASRDPHGVTIAYANRIMHDEKMNVEGMRRILAVEALSANWRESFRKRLERLHLDTKE
jgi:MOSC domain-containing protein YiiM